MSRVKNLTLFMVGLLFCYVMLIGGDFVLSRYKGTLNQLSNEDGRIIEKKRFQEEDVGYRLLARDAGYLPALYPSLIDDNATLRKIVIERGYGPLGGVPNAETYYCNEGYGLVTYRSDRFGLRNDDAKWDKDIDVIFIGDSFIHGACVDKESTIPQLFEKRTGDNTLNLGLSANNPLHYKTYASLFIPQAKPKKVFMVFYYNDKGAFDSLLHDMYFNKGDAYFAGDSMNVANPKLINEVARIALSTLLKQQEQHEQIEQLEEESQRETGALAFIEKLLNSFNYRKNLPTIRLLLKNRFDDQLTSSSKDALISTKNLCDEVGCEVSVIYIPNSTFWRPDSYAEKYANQLDSLAAELDVKFFDARKVLNNGRGSADYAVKGAHLSPEGYRKVVSLLFQ